MDREESVFTIVSAICLVSAGRARSSTAFGQSAGSAAAALFREIVDRQHPGAMHLHASVTQVWSRGGHASGAIGAVWAVIHDGGRVAWIRSRFITPAANDSQGAMHR
jgi:hypothetical protein